MEHPGEQIHVPADKAEMLQRVASVGDLFDRAELAWRRGDLPSLREHVGLDDIELDSLTFVRSPQDGPKRMVCWRLPTTGKLICVEVQY
jgi:hypothetical protein